jgi:phosphoglycerol transferase MdoB-like AlkP superfamily enzyme
VKTLKYWRFQTRMFSKQGDISLPKRTVLLTIASTVLSVLLVFGIEVLHRESMQDAWTWLKVNPGIMALNTSITLSLLLLLHAVVNRFSLAAGATVWIMLTMSLISFYKIKFIGEPFFPWDLLLKRESLHVIPMVTSSGALKKIGLILFITGGVLLVGWRMTRLSMPVIARVLLGVSSAFVLYSFGVSSLWLQPMLDRAQVGEIVWNQQQNYQQNGMQLAFALNVKHSIVPKPSNYNEASMAKLAERLAPHVETAASDASLHAPLGKPYNVIFIMNEAFWDPTRLPNVTFSEDPLPTVRRLQAESVSGNMLSPQFGGGTSNVEFEVLTGNSMSFLPAGSVPYQQHIGTSLPSLASYFEQQGYKSVGIHSYEGWFWNREQIYEHLGFQRFMSQEQFQSPEYRGFYISDEEVSRTIIDEVENTEEPMFIYAVTMQNHGPYNDNRYGEGGIKVEGQLTDEARQILETYLQGVKDADQSLQMLIDHFEQSEEPTVIVFYGDHLPMLGYDYDVYTQGGMVHTGNSEQWSLEELLAMRSVPFAMWSNQALPAQQVPVLSASFMGAFVLDTLGLPKPASFQLQAELSRQLPGLLGNLVVDASGNLYPSVPEVYLEEVEQYQQLQYDFMFGRRYFSQLVDQDVET